MTKTHWMVGGDPAKTVCWAAFTETDVYIPDGPYERRVTVLALEGAAYYTQKSRITLEEAREEWRRLREKGWRKATAEEVKAAGVTVRVLERWIFS